MVGGLLDGLEPEQVTLQRVLGAIPNEPLDVLHDTIQPFPTFSEVYLHALAGLAAEEQR